MNANRNAAGNPIITVSSDAEQPAKVVKADADSEFARFETLTATLMQVPTSEINDQRATT
jgi:hypothetical protein